MAENSTDIEEVLIDIVRNDLAIDVPAIDSSSQLISDLGLDSVAFAVALVAIEERLELRLSEEELMGCRTLGDVEGLVCRHSAAPVQASEIVATS